MAEKFSERREFKRLKTRIMAHYTVEGEKEFNISPADNISANGILLETDKILPIDTRIDLRIDFPPDAKTLVCKGRVVRIDEKIRFNKYAAGISFINMAKEDKELIKRHIERIDINNILTRAVNLKASDVHLTVDHPPIVRIYGELKSLGSSAYTKEDLKQIIYSILNNNQRSRFENTLELDCSYTLPNNDNRFRVNIHMQQGNVEAAFRLIPHKIPTIEELKLPPVVKDLALKKNGLIIVTGPAGSGKSTTVAAMLELINQTRGEVIVSLEDPIEFIFESKRCVIKQREVGIDTVSFNTALKHVLRQDPNIIFIGEIRDAESVATAISAAETGHLVITTLHTSDTVQSINRIIDMFSSSQQPQIRLQLSECLRGVIGQLLFPQKDGKGLVAATEILITTSAISSLIRQGQTQQIYTLLQTGLQYNMRTMDTSLLELFKIGLVDYETIITFAKEPSLFKKDPKTLKK